MAATAILMENQTNWDKYQLVRAARPFSLVVAVAACLQGIILGWGESDQPFLLSGLILLGGILLQFGVNLINDYSDLDELDKLFPSASSPQYQWLSQRIQRNFYYGLSCFAFAIVIGFCLIQLRDNNLLYLCLIGGMGAYFYTQKPINYKNRGLGVPLVFWLMGIMMIGGAYYVMSGQYSIAVFLHSLPLSLLTSLLLLSNELRDYESDREVGQKTLTVRLGYPRAVKLYWLILIGTYASVMILWLSNLLTFPWFILLSLLAVRTPLSLLHASVDKRKMLTPLTGRFHGVFALTFLSSYLLN